jgi:hypothetical protein
VPELYNFADDGTLDEGDNKKLGESLRKGRDRAPSSRIQTESYRYFQESQSAMLGAPYDVSKIPIDVLTQMKYDSMIAFADHFITMPLLNARWHIESEDAQVAAFIDNSLRRIYGDYILQRSQSHFYGFKPIVKRFELANPDWRYLDPTKSDTTIPVWDSENVDALIWKHFVGLPSDPNISEPIFNAKGEFNGIKYTPEFAPSTSFSFVQTNDGKTQKIPVKYAIWAVNQRHTVNGSMWGFPRIGYAYRYWFSYWLRWALYDRYFERKADPPYVVYYPTDPMGGDVDSDNVNLKTHALMVGDSAKSGGTIALPGDFERGFDDRPSNSRQWEIKELEINGDLSNFVESFEYLDKMKLRALLVPDQALMGAGGATSNRNAAEQEIDMFMQSEASEMEQIDDEINRYIIPDLIAANFPDRNVTAKKVTTGFDEADKDTMKEIIRVVGQSDQKALKSVDFEKILDAMGVPSINHDELVRREQAVKDEIASATPDPLTPIPGEQAGIDEEGFYIQPREIIRLAEDSDFVTALPPSKHYTDEEVLKFARQIRAKWDITYKDIYDDIAEFLSTQTLIENFADDEANRLAYQIVSKWNFAVNKTRQIVDETKDLVKNIIARAGQKELARIRTNANWEADTESVASYLDERGAMYVKAIEDTIRDEVASYLANGIRDGKSIEEIAAGVREHFSEEFPSWKSIRLVRSEVRDAYNFATLEAGQQAGIKVVQAKDAQYGDTDEECEERNGNFYSIPQALVETLKEHPNGTLEWKLIPDVNSVSEITVNASELDDDEIAYYNEETNTIYFSDNSSESEKIKFRLALGEVLAS